MQAKLDQWRKKMSEPGLIVSGAAHVALLVAALAAFSSTQKFSDAQEATPVEFVTESELNQIMKGEKTAKEAKPTPRKADKVAETPAPKPQPATPIAVADTPVPPPPLRRAPEPVADAAPAKIVTPPARPRSEPVKVAQATPAKTAAGEPDPPEDPDNPLVVRPVPRIVKLDPPTPPKRVRPAEKPPQTELKLDEVAKLLEQKKAQLKPDVPTPAPTPKPAAVQPAPTPARTYDPNSIAKLLSHDKPQQTAAAAPEVTQTASIGAPSASAAKMSPTLMAALDGLMMDQYNQCWTDNGIGANGYVPQIRVQYGPDGSLIGQPTLTNPPADPALRSLADDALRAVRKCNPLKIPAQYAPFYEQWRQRLLRMNPEDRTG